jgi:hypothetical protein
MRSQHGWYWRVPSVYAPGQVGERTRRLRYHGVTEDETRPWLRTPSAETRVRRETCGERAACRSRDGRTRGGGPSGVFMFG